MNDSMKTYLIEPLAPLIIRSGRPFDGQAGVDEARFPPPSTVAGALRTAHAETVGKPLDPGLAKIRVAGPLAVRLDDAGSAVSLLVPKPADALYFRSVDRSIAQVISASPMPLGSGEGTDGPAGLLPVQLTTPVVGKQASGPRWWSWDDLAAFRRGITTSLDQIQRHGWMQPADEIRTHVAIDRVTQAAETGRLFQTSGLAFMSASQGKTEFGQAKLPAHRVGLIGQIEGEIGDGLISLGGERRLSAIAAARGQLWPAMPDGLPGEMRNAKGICLTLLTPALFAAGWRPAWLNQDREGAPPGIGGLKLRLRAATLERWQPHSGWDLALRRPRAGRKLVPSGAVYWFEIVEANDDALAAFWLVPISDHEQDRRDGFGLALIHPWTPPHTN